MVQKILCYVQASFDLFLKFSNINENQTESQKMLGATPIEGYSETISTSHTATSLLKPLKIEEGEPPRSSIFRGFDNLLPSRTPSEFLG